MFRLTIITTFIVLLCSIQPVLANMTENSMKEDPRHIENWNRFAARLLKLNNSLLKHYDVRQSESVGCYANHNAPIQTLINITVRQMTHGNFVSLMHPATLSMSLARLVEMDRQW